MSDKERNRQKRDAKLFFLSKDSNWPLLLSVLPIGLGLFIVERVVFGFANSDWMVLAAPLIGCGFMSTAFILRLKKINAIGKIYKPKNVPSENVEELLKMAEAGNIDAMLTLRDFYEAGYKVPVNPHEAITWAYQAAKLGSASAQCSVGIAYLEGKYLQKDIEVAIEWLKRAALQDYAGACIAMANVLYLYPEYCPDAEQVEFWLKKGFSIHHQDAEEGNSDAMVELSISYLLGEINGVAMDKDYIKGIKLLEKAAELQNVMALITLGNIYRCMYQFVPDSKRDFLEGVITKDEDRAFDLYAKAVKIGGSKVLSFFVFGDVRRIKRHLNKRL